MAFFSDLAGAVVMWVIGTIVAAVTLLLAFRFFLKEYEMDVKSMSPSQRSPSGLSS